jgi:putative tryptophan/tyrosine transport system substrate-binding protein
MKRREFIAGLGSAVAWPLATRAQQGDRIRRIAVLMPFDENDPFAKLQLSNASACGFGLDDGRNVRMDFRWAGGDINRIRAFAQELVGLQPNIIVASSTPVAAALQRETRTKFIAGLGGVAAWSVVSHAQQGSDEPSIDQWHPRISGKSFKNARKPRAPLRANFEP